MKEEYDNYDKWFEEKPKPVEKPKPREKTLDEFLRYEPKKDTSDSFFDISNPVWMACMCG